MDASLNEHTLYPYRTKRGFGVSNGSEWIVAPKYKWLQSFYGGYAYGETFDGTQFLLDRFGNEHDLIGLVSKVCPPGALEYINPNNAIDSPGCIVVRTLKETLVLSLDKNLRVSVIEAFCRNWEIAPYYGVDYLLIRVNEAGKYRTLISHPSLGKLSLEGIQYIDPPYWGCELLAVKFQEDSTWAYYDLVNREFCCDRFFLAHSFSNGFGLLQRSATSPLAFFDRRFERISELEFEWADVFRHGLAAGAKDDVSGYFDTKGICRFKNDGGLGRFNRCGHTIVENSEGCFEIFNEEGVCQVADLNACTYFDGDFPFYEVEQNGKCMVLASDLNTVKADR